jgi:hypothetical protein
MRIISAIIVAALATSLAGCLSYSRHEREDRVVEHRHGGYHRGDRQDHHDHHRHRHHPRGR